MFNSKYIIGLLLTFTTILIIISCNKSEDTLVNNPELVFTNSLRIDVGPYEYFNTDSTEMFRVLGDSAIAADTVSATPVFEWNNMTTGLVTVVISKEEFIVSDNNLVNADQIIWQWQPGMEAGERGKVAYLEGKTVNNKKILYDTQPLPLESGLYYWAVWSWEISGRKIVRSTKSLKIFVE